MSRASNCLLELISWPRLFDYLNRSPKRKARYTTIAWRLSKMCSGTNPVNHLNRRLASAPAPNSRIRSALCRLRALDSKRKTKLKSLRHHAETGFSKYPAAAIITGSESGYRQIFSRIKWKANDDHGRLAVRTCNSRSQVSDSGIEMRSSGSLPSFPNSSSSQGYTPDISSGRYGCELQWMSWCMPQPRNNYGTASFRL